MTKARVLLCDDAEEVRLLLRLELGFDPEIEVIGEAQNGAEVVDAAQELQPDVIVLDLAMPLLDGLESLVEIRRLAPEAKVIVLSGFNAAAMARHALALGASAYVQKGTPPGELLRVIKDSLGHAGGGPREGQGPAEPAPVLGLPGAPPAQEAFEEILERFTRVFEDAAVGMSLVGMDGRFLRVNRSVCEITGYAEAELLAASLQSITHPDDLARDEEVDRRLVEGEIRTHHVEKRLRGAGGRPVWVMLSRSLVCARDGRPLYFIVQIQDISERKELECRLEHEALHDSLTGLANRVLFLDRVQHALLRRVREKQKAAVLFLDLDDFKTINDSLGHAAGDEVLRVVANRLERCVRSEDTVARLGGDEFAVLVEGAESIESLHRLAQRIANSVQAPFALQGKDMFIHASIGIALAHRRGERADELLRNADAAMYAAKRSGKGRHELYEAHMHSAAVRRLSLKLELQKAVEAEEFVLHYQPIYSLEDRRISQAEALVRWLHPRRGLVPPLEFIPLAEESGLILPMTRWILREACREAASWHVRFPGRRAPGISINLSAARFQRPNLVEEIASVLGEAGLEPSSLILEITESVLMQDREMTVERLTQLKDLGVRLAIDDFGTGYSSLSYVRDFPIHILKIDKTFISSLLDGPDRSALARGIIKLGQILKLELIAEGVEARGQMEELQSLGCGFAQGNYLCEPIGTARMRALLAEQGVDLASGTHAQ
ncbi:MAG: EAL domain-containing protein [Actinomycetota bacterium]|nr:EAL domain-containing protein [Actinomycetota bacterium]